jgi:hypothetical protein
VVENVWKFGNGGLKKAQEGFLLFTSDTPIFFFPLCFQDCYSPVLNQLTVVGLLPFAFSSSHLFFVLVVARESR